MPIIYPDPFNPKDLTLDVRLEAFLDGELYDYTGKKHYNIGLMKDGVGFGITNIQIEINTSLQPVIEIEFKDLYGSTLFGGENNPYQIDYSTIFRWPPPKFRFSYKGYLGKYVTWDLALMDYSIDFVANDGSYTIKARFVPNQWGFFGDLPFHFLLAAKALKKFGQQTSIQDLINNPNLDGTTNSSSVETKNSDSLYQGSIFDLINIGKKVEIERQEVTDVYNSLIKQLTSLRSSPLEAIVRSQVVSFGENISGSIDGFIVPDFKSIKIQNIFNQSNQIRGFSSLEEINGRPYTEEQDINAFICTRIEVAGSKSNRSNISYENFRLLSDQEKKAESSRVNKALDENIEAVNQEILSKQFIKTKTKLNKITLSSVMSQLAGDSAFIIGKILEEGYKGKRDRNSSTIVRGRSAGFLPEIIGDSYPLVIKESEELPATQENAGQSFRVEENEMRFVETFTEAIVEGIIQNTINQATQEVLRDGALKNRVSNLEALRGNPYKPFAGSIIRSAIQRSGVFAFLTMSDDPNKPGNYDTSLDVTSVDWLSNFRSENAKKAAQNDLKNVTEDILKAMDFDNLSNLKKFAQNWGSIFSSDGNFLLNQDGSPNEDLDLSEIGNIPTETVSNDIVSYEITSDDGQISMSSLLSQIQFDGLNSSTYTSDFFVHNLTPYFMPKISPDGETNFFVAFHGDDAQSMRELVGDSEDNSVGLLENATSNKVGRIFASVTPLGVILDSLEVFEYKPEGLVNIQQLGDETSDAQQDMNQIIEQFNAFVRSGLVLDYSKIKEIEGANDSISYENLMWRKQVVVGSEQLNDPNTQVKLTENTRLSFLVFSNQIGNYVQDQIVFGLFLKDRRGQRQREFLKEFFRGLVEKIQEVEREKSNEIARIVGSANSDDTKNIIYKQFHNLFHQWHNLAYSFNDNRKIIIENLALEMLELYGANHIALVDGVDVSSQQNTTFFYDYPLQRIADASGGVNKLIDVRNSVINIDPLEDVNERTTVLNVMYNICSKNNFLFIPIPGYPGYLDVEEVFSTSLQEPTGLIRNFFHILFIPTPESRAFDGKTHSFSIQDENQRNIKASAIGLEFGSVDNQIAKNINVGTKNNKVTAESILNLHRLTDNENRNKTVTTDCSMLNVLGGRSYQATVDTLGNASIYPMQFFYLDRMPLFGGLYQIMNVKHSITPNNMDTTFEGIKMRYNTSYGGIEPITLETLQDEFERRGRVQAEEIEVQNTADGEDETGNSRGNNEIISDDETRNDEEVILLPNVAQIQNSARLKTFSSGPIRDNLDGATMIASKRTIIQNMNNMIEDVLEPFAEFLKQRDVTMFRNIQFTSAARKYKSGGGTTSQHLKGQAIDMQPLYTNTADGLLKVTKLFNYIMEFYEQNPDKEYGQLLLETNRGSRPEGSIWIHWSYRRGGDNQRQRHRWSGHNPANAPMNTPKYGQQATSQVTIQDARTDKLLV